MVRPWKFLSILVAVMLLLIAVPLAFAQTDTGNQDVVAVTLSDFRIDLPESIPSGDVTFEITNEGDVEHSFQIEGNGIEEGLETTLQPGETRQLDVTLEPGDYRIYSSANDDVAQGMDMQVTVVEAAADETVSDVTAEDTTVNQPEDTTADTAVEADTTTEGETFANQPAALPQTGAVSFPWTEMALVGGGLALVAIGLGLVLSLRRHS